jgi:hypothetical protein
VIPEEKQSKEEKAMSMARIFSTNCLMSDESTPLFSAEIIAIKPKKKKSSGKQPAHHSSKK